MRGDFKMPLFRFLPFVLLLGTSLFFLINLFPLFAPVKKSKALRRSIEVRPEEFRVHSSPGQLFDLQMGKGTAHWDYLKTPEDRGRLDLFRTLFEKFEKGERGRGSIPKVAHFVWLGPSPFPPRSIQGVQQWIDLHPEWTFKFWTDLDRAAPDSRMQVHSVRKFPFQFLEKAYYDSTNFGEKGRLLCYEIIFKEGGVAIDHDLVPFKSLDSLVESAHFFCGLEKLAPSVLTTSVIPSPHLIGAIPFHRTLEHALLWLQDRWTFLEESFPGSRPEEVENRMMHRVVWALSEGINRGIDRISGLDVVLPSLYFSERTRKGPSFAVHLHEKSWIRPLDQIEMGLKGELSSLVRKEDQAILLTICLACTSLITAGFVLGLIVQMGRAHR